MLQLNHEAVPDAVPLTQREKALKAELEAVVRAGFETFMRVGEALCEIRRHRLFRAEYITFSDYVRSEFGMALSTANGLLNSARIAEELIEDGVQLPADTLPSSIKALSGVPAVESLRSVVWEYAASLSPARAPSSTMVSRVVRLVRFELDDVSDDMDSDEELESGREGYQRGPRKTPSAELRSKPSEPLPAREVMFLPPCTRLATFSQFSPALVVSTVQPANASTAYRTCELLIARLRLVQQCLEQSFPGEFKSSH